MNSTITWLTALIISTTFLDAEKWQAGIRLNHSDISGTRTFDADQKQIYDSTDSLFVPSIYIKRQLGEKFHISAEYSSFNNIESKGISPSTDVFNEGGLAFTALTEYNITEDIHELTISVLYEAWSNDNWNLNFGPALSISYSDTDFELPLSNFHLRNYTETDETMGFQIGLDYINARNFITGLNYRFSNLPSRDVHLIGVYLGMKW